ncbi:hypothetical protein GOV05_05480 [Candidatus Woesearchaeota archaeon]|nr:hypothetical protein [Candidatus Woesearchaeota archaeon]
MELFVTCRVGFEEFLEKELVSFGFSSIKKKSGCCVCNADSYKDIVGFSYFSSMIIRCGVLLFETIAKKDLDSMRQDLVRLVEGIGFEEFFDESSSFMIESKRVGKHSFSSNDFEKCLGATLLEEIKGKLGFVPRVDLENPDIIFYSQIIDEDLVVGVDFVGFDSNKRDYKVFSNPHSIRGDLGRAMVISSLKNVDKEVVVDPFCNDGVIGVETSLYASGRSHNFYRKKDFVLKKLKPLQKIDVRSVFEEIDKKEKMSPDFLVSCFDPLFNNVSFSQKNSKIAGVDKYLGITRLGIDSLDLKFDDKSVDAIISVLPSKSKHYDEKKLLKTYEVFFLQASLLLKKEGVLTFLSERNISDLLEENNFLVNKKIVISNSKILYSCKKK